MKRLNKATLSRQSDALFDRFIVLANPTSTRYRQAKHRISGLKQLFPDKPVDVIVTSPDGREANTTLLLAQADKLGPRTLLCVAAGDGTVNLVVETLVHNRKLSAKARRTPILPLWGGNGNDLACMLNGLASSHRLRTVFKRGRVVPIHPLLCRLTDKDGKEQVRIAASYAGFGASAQLSKRFNEPAHRQSTLQRFPGGLFLKTASTALSALFESPTFAIEELGTSRVLYERTFLNGPRVAIAYHQPVRLRDERFYLDTWEGKRPVVTPLRAFLSFKRPNSSDRLQERAEFTIKKETWAQVDGEPFKVPADTKIEIQISGRPFYAWSALLATEQD